MTMKKALKLIGVGVLYVLWLVVCWLGGVGFGHLFEGVMDS